MNPIPDPSWWQEYGPIGVVAMLALGALAWVVVRVVLKGWEADKARQAADMAAKQAAIDAKEALVNVLYGQLLTMLQKGHADTLTLLAQQRAECNAERVLTEARHQEALAEARAELKEARDQVGDIGGRAVRALSSLGKKIRLEEDGT